MLLHHETLSAAGSTPTRALLFLHGILGSGRNLYMVARRFVEARPAWQAVLLDLRAHGASLGAEGPDSLDAAAADVAQTARTLDLPVRGVFGHSFGGKVALRLVELLPGLEQVVLVDSGPGLRTDHRGSEATLEVVRLLESLHGPWPSRDAFVREVEALGQPRSIAQWLGMNLRREASGFHFTLEVARIRALLDSYFAHDLWPVVEAAARGAGGPAIHVVIGERSRAFEHEDRVRVSALEAEARGRVTMDLLPCGHWVHVEAFEGLIDVLTTRMEG